MNGLSRESGVAIILPFLVIINNNPNPFPLKVSNIEMETAAIYSLQD